MEKLMALEDGESIELDDHWVRKFTSAELNADERNAVGKTNVRSDGSFRAVREGDTIRIVGVVDHKRDDPYDFKAGNEMGDQALALVKSGRADFFRMKAEYSQRLEGTLTIENGRLTDPKFEWTDLNRPGADKAAGSRERRGS